MKMYLKEVRSRAIDLRLQGKTYQEINELLNQIIPKSTISYWFRELILSPEVQDNLSKKIAQKLTVARGKAVTTNKIKRSKFLFSLEEINLPISKRINDSEIAKIALAMLCLGEAAKYGSGAGFYLGSSNPKIIVLFMKLLKICFHIDSSKFRFTIQCRADQNVMDLEKYWRGITGVESGLFYKPRADSRTIGKPTKNVDYKGVLRVDYLDTKIQLELESLTNLIYNQAVRL